MRPVLLAVARDAVKKLFAFLRRFDADAEDLHLAFEITFPFINKGRHLGPAPGSPTAAVKKYHVAGAFLKTAGKSTVAPSISLIIASGNRSPTVSLA